MTAEVDVLWNGEQISHLDNVGFRLAETKNKQNEGYGLRGDLKLVRTLPGYEMYFSPFIRYWSIGESENSLAATGVLLIGTEPRNETSEIGGQAGLRF